VAAETMPALTFCLGGLSKGAGLPQMKLGWIAGVGPEALLQEAWRRLELVCDTYLSVGTPVQRALPALLELGAGLRGKIAERAQANRQNTLAAALAGSAAQLFDAEGGWSAIVRLPSTPTEEEHVLALLDYGVLVHPGFFFDLPSTAVVISLLVAPATLDASLAAILRRCTH